MENFRKPSTRHEQTSAANTPRRRNLLGVIIGICAIALAAFVYFGGLGGDGVSGSGNTTIDSSDPFADKPLSETDSSGADAVDGTILQ